MSSRTRKVAAPKTDEDLAAAKLMVRIQKAEAEAAKALEAIQTKHGVVFQFAIGGITLKAVPQ